MRRWWLKRSLRLRLAVWYGLAGLGALIVCTILLVALDQRKPFGGWAFTMGAAAVLVIATVILLLSGYLIAGHALKPVKEMAERTRRLSAKSLNERLPVANPHDELGQLAIVFNSALEQLENSFAELKRFTADVSHELRTPLTAMRAVGEVAMRERNPAVLHDAVGSMLEEISRMNQLIERLLLLARADDDEIPVKFEAGLVREPLTEICEALSLVAEEKKQELELSCESDLLAVFDSALLRLALMNLVQNAIRYSPPGSMIRLRAFRHYGSPLIEVADQGPGIAQEHQERIFERFYRVDKARSRSEGGAGLGLAITKWAVERMDGSIELKSELGKGSAFRVRLRPVMPLETPVHP